MSKQELSAIDLIKEFHEISWEMADYLRDKRYPVTPDQPFRPKKDVPPVLLKKLVSLNHMCSEALQILHRPDVDIQESNIPEEIIQEVEVSKEDIKKGE